MANCTQCGAPVGDDVRFCSYCGTRLNVIDENLGKLILSNTEAIKTALEGSGAHFGVSGKYLEPISYKDLNAEYYIPLLETKDGAIVVSRLTGGNSLAYQILFVDEDPIDWAWQKVEELVVRDRVSQWFAGWLRCPECLKKYHITYADPAILMRAAECPHCAVDKAIRAATMQVDNGARRIGLLEANPPKKPNFFSTEDERHEYQRWEQALANAPSELADHRSRLAELEGIGTFIEQNAEQPLGDAAQVESWLATAVRIRQ